MVLVALGLLAPAGLRSQKPDTPPQKASVRAEKIFSGTITQLTGESFTVIHKVPGQPAVMRQFMRDGKTTVEGKLRSKVRVTVRYKALDDGGFIALHIIVRS